ncbi:hypothetical protein, partial [Streptomyces eurythermus]|uniref:hypothetical protein n=1 Tax=Streptomyces eurythermus TaxID=42237 RepID=UPI0033D4214D
MQLIIDGEKDGRGRNLGYQVDAQIGTGRAALFATGMTVFHLLYDLCVHSECIEPLRQEIVELGDVPLSKANLAKLRKMDSFIRECQRWTKFMLSTSIGHNGSSWKLANLFFQLAPYEKSSSH